MWPCTPDWYNRRHHDGFPHLNPTSRSSGPMIVPLTSLRGLAALAVVGFHYAPFIAGIPIFNRGFLGVDLFFLLSGFILTNVYSKEITARSFFVARFARTYPLHLFILATLLPCFGRAPVYSADSFLCNLTMTQVLCGGPLSWNSVSWSLSAEWICYFLFPILLRPVLLCPRWTAGVLILGCAGIIIAISPITRFNVYRMGALCRALPEFLVGMILYRAYCHKWLAHWGYFLGAIIVLISALATRAPDILVVLTFAAFILASPYVRAMEHKALSSLGDISYSLYMVHLLIRVFVIQAMMAIGIRNDLATAGIGIGASVLFAVVTYRYVEVPARAAVRMWMAGSSGGSPNPGIFAVQSQPDGTKDNKVTFSTSPGSGPSINTGPATASVLASSSPATPPTVDVSHK
jgi:peptidoglycan/LPS O-acetylase OafA/YrhL